MAAAGAFQEATGGHAGSEGQAQEQRRLVPGETFDIAQQLFGGAIFNTARELLDLVGGAVNILRKLTLVALLHAVARLAE